MMALKNVQVEDPPESRRRVGSCLGPAGDSLQRGSYRLTDECTEGADNIFQSGSERHSRMTTQHENLLLTILMATAINWMVAPYVVAIIA